MPAVKQHGKRRGSAFISVVAAILAAGALRVALAGYSPWFDEFASLAFAERPLSDLWSGWMVRETNPPLFYSLLHGWLALWGHSLIALRMLPILCGTIGIAIAAAIAGRAYGRRASVIVVLIVGLSAQHIYYSHTLRAYGLAFDGIGLSLLGLILLAGKPAELPKGAVLYALGAIVAIYSHTTLFLWPLMAMAGFGMVRRRDLLRWDTGLAKALLIANAGIALASAWWLNMTLAQLRVSRGNIDWIPSLDVPESLQLIARSAFLVRGEGEGFGMLAWLLVALTLAAAVRTWRRPATRLIVSIGLAAVVVLCLAEVYRPILLERTAFWLSFFPLLLLAGGIAGIERAIVRHAATASLAVLLALNLVQASAEFERQDWIPSMKRIAEEPAGALLVEHEALGVVSLEACRVAFDAQACPFPIVTMRSADASNVWAKGLHAKALVEPRLVYRAFAPRARIFALRQGGLDVVSNLGAMGAPVRPTASRAWPEGPYRPADFELP